MGLWCNGYLRCFMQTYASYRALLASALMRRHQAIPVRMGIWESSFHGCPDRPISN